MHEGLEPHQHRIDIQTGNSKINGRSNSIGSEDTSMPDAKHSVIRNPATTLFVDGKWFTQECGIGGTYNTFKVKDYYSA